MIASFIPIIKEKTDILTSKQKYIDYISSSKANISNTGKLETMYDSNWTENF
jgi:hypothetical protein